MYLKVIMCGCHLQTAASVFSFGEVHLMVSYARLSPGELHMTAIPDGSPLGALLQLDTFSNEPKQRNKAIC